MHQELSESLQAFGKVVKWRAMDELALIAAAKKGDLDSFNTLVLTYQHQVYNLAYRIMGDPAEASDATQEAFISAWRHIKDFRGGVFRAWLLRIVTNACYDELRRVKRRPASSLESLYVEDPTPDADLPPSQLESPEAFAQRRELNRVIQVGIAQLPPDQRIALVLSDVQGMSYEEIAEISGANLGTVKSRLSRARAKLRDLLLENRELVPASYRLQSEGV
jgi:RNA polymerase sigma-70 factor (ECF subfamily)